MRPSRIGFATAVAWSHRRGRGGSGAKNTGPEFAAADRPVQTSKDSEDEVFVGKALGLGVAALCDKHHEMSGQIGVGAAEFQLATNSLSLL